MAIAIVMATAANAQKYTVSGIIIDNDTKEAIPSATVQVLRSEDEKYVAGAATTVDGTFTIKDLEKGKYKIKVTYIGYKAKTQALELSISKAKKNTDLGFITLETDNVLLAETQVTANASKVKVSGDSIIFNASAYRTPAGSTLEALVKKLPGAKVDENGQITINGKTVNKIMINGKEFFLNDTQTAMKNIPVEIIDNIKSYDRKSDMARVTGIDDGEDETVLDLSVKKGMMNGWIGNLNGGVGTESRYSARANVMRVTETSQVTILGGMNNVSDMGFGGGGGRGWGWGGGGLRASKNAGINFATTSDKLETGGSVRFNYNGSDSRTQASQQSFVNKSGSFSESLSQSYTSNINVNTQFRLEWKPDTMTNIIFRPSYTYSRDRGYSYSTEGTFSKDPNEFTDSPLDSLVARKIDRLTDIVVNTNMSRQQTYSESNNLQGTLQANRKLNDDGRNITLRLNGGINNGESQQLSAADIYYKHNDSHQFNNRYYNTPSRRNNISARLTYSEPIAYKTYLQFGYDFGYNYNKNDRQAYIYESTKDAFDELYNSLDSYRYDVDGILRYMDEVAQQSRVYDEKLSQFSEYKTYQHTASVSFRRVTDFSNFSVGVDLIPINTSLHYIYQGKTFDISQNQFNFSPRIQYRYQPDRMTQLRINYNSRMNQPNLTNLLDITDDSNPLYITKGNPNLTPAFNHNIRVNYNTYKEETQRSYFGYLSGGFTQNSISNIVEYDSLTGVRTTTPENINGNWNVNGGFGFNTPLDQENKYFTIDAFTNLGYRNNVGYTQLANENVKSKTKSFDVGQSASLSYRRDLIEISLNGDVNYQHSRNNITDANKQDSWNFSYGMDFQYTTGFGLTITSDIGMNSRRGYSSESMNTDELLWNAQISQTFLKGNLTVMLEWNDILGEQSNISRTINEMMRRDSRTNSIYQYGMLRVTYKFNTVGGNSPFKGRGGMGGFGGGFGRF